MLTSQQKEIVESDIKKAMVLASAGSGKTFMLTHKIEYLIKEKKISPSKMFLFSFSRSATKEMRNRLKESLSTKEFSELNISTFHSFCYHLIVKYLNYAPVKKDFSVISEDQLKGIIKNNIAYMDKYGKIDSSCVSVEDIQSHYYSYRWSKVITSDNNKPTPTEKLVLENVISYLDTINTYTFNDIIVISISILEKYSNVKEEVQSSFSYMILDEAQDTQSIITRLLGLIINESHSLYIVGDIQQTLYRFAGADPFLLLEFMESWNSHIFYLNETFRFGDTVGDIANKIIEKIDIEDRYKIPTFTKQKSEESERVLVNIKNEKTKMDFVVKQIKKLYEAGVPYNNINILSRVNSQLASYNKLLLEEGIPSVIKGGNILQRKEVIFVLSVLSLFRKAKLYNLEKVFENYNVGVDKYVLKNVMEDFKGETVFHLIEYISTTKIKEVGEERKKALLGVLRKVIKSYEDVSTKCCDTFSNMADNLEMKSFKFMQSKDETGSDSSERFATLHILDDLLSDYTGNIFDFETHLKLTFTTDNENNPKGVILRTIHASKGMSLPYVFLDMTRFCSFQDFDIIDEQFCFYVGVTRTKYKLFCIADHENIFNEYLSDLKTTTLEDSEDFDSYSSIENTISPENIKTELDISMYCFGTKRDCSFLIQKPSKLIRATEKAVMLQFGSNTTWIPKKCIYYSKNDDLYFANNWWLSQKGNNKFLKK